MCNSFELGKAKAVKGQGWVPPFISCAEDSGTLTPTAPTDIRLREIFTFFLPNSRQQTLRTVQIDRQHKKMNRCSFKLLCSGIYRKISVS